MTRRPVEYSDGYVKASEDSQRQIEKARYEGATLKELLGLAGTLPGRTVVAEVEREIGVDRRGRDYSKPANRAERRAALHGMRRPGSRRYRPINPDMLRAIYVDQLQQFALEAREARKAKEAGQ